MKVGIFDRKLFKTYLVNISGISTGLSLALIFVEIPPDLHIRVQLAIFFVITIIGLYIYMWIRANSKKQANILVNETHVEIKTGDIFMEEGSLKIIPFNEYFDTQVDDIVISSNTLNGQYILHHLNESATNLNRRISNDDRLKGKVTFIDGKRCNSKLKYPLGTIYKNGDYLLLAFSKFDNENRAYLDKKSLWECLINMWNELDICYSGSSICLPLLGTGLTRKHNMNLSDQEMLELIITSLKVSGVKFNCNAHIKIIIYPSNAKAINFYSLTD